MTSYPKLANPPIVVAIMQIVFKETGFDVESYLKYEEAIRKILPHRHNNINVNTNLNLDSPTLPLGVSKTSATTEAKYESFVFMTLDSKRKLELSKNTITYIVENGYSGWAEFIADGVKLIGLFDEILSDKQIDRTSIRFINKFLLDEFEHPEEYFNTLISRTTDDALPYRVAQYGFRMMLDITKDTYGIINQSVDKVADKYNYFFDIDVLNKEKYNFSLERINQNCEKLRSYKNELFFNNITSKTLELCK